MVKSFTQFFIIRLKKIKQIYLSFLSKTKCVSITKSNPPLTTTNPMRKNGFLSLTINQLDQELSKPEKNTSLRSETELKLISWIHQKGIDLIHDLLLVNNAVQKMRTRGSLIQYL